jgi:hypothetical protein
VRGPALTLLPYHTADTSDEEEEVRELSARRKWTDDEV